MVKIQLKDFVDYGINRTASINKANSIARIKVIDENEDMAIDEYRENRDIRNNNLRMAIDIYRKIGPYLPQNDRNYGLFYHNLAELIDNQEKDLEGEEVDELVECYKKAIGNSLNPDIRNKNAIKLAELHMENEEYDEITNEYFSKILDENYNLKLSELYLDAERSKRSNAETNPVPKQNTKQEISNLLERGPRDVIQNTWNFNNVR